MHLGLPLYNEAERERKIVRWLESVKPYAKEIYMLGDVFDFWWEYKHVVPRGYVRFIGKLAELTDSGVAIHWLTGNHDVWAGSYLEKECGVMVHHVEVELQTNGKRFFLAHGDGLGKQDKMYKALKWIFTNRPLQRLYSMMHPWWGMSFGRAWSRSSRLAKGIAIPFKGESENLYQFAVQKSAEEKIDSFIFGHRHTPVLMNLPGGAQMAILSDWIAGATYADFDGEKLELKTFEEIK
jgi:UDP-2,3-diacylglucosamine hydrolase